MSIPRGLLFLMGCMALFLVLYYHRFVVFPQFRSADFEAHVRIATDYARQLPTLAPPSQVFLYGGVEYFLALFLKVFPSIAPIAVSRYAMGVLVILSVPMVWYAAKSLFPGAGFVITSVYVLGGFVWFNAVFNSGLYANFYGLLASLFLLITVTHFVEKPPTLFSTFLLLAAIGNALISHYSVLLLSPALYLTLAWLAIKHRPMRKSALIALLLLLSPLGALAAYPGVLSTLSGFTSGPALAGPSLTPMAQWIPLPSLAYIATEIAPPVPIRTDFAPFAVLAFAFAGILFLRRKDWRLSLVVFWFLTVLAFGNWGSAWRFAEVGLVPITFLAGLGFHSVISSLFLHIDRRHVFRSEFISKKHFAGFFCVVMLSVPIFFMSWGGASFALSVSPDSSAFASNDQAIVQTLQWVRTHAGGCGHNETRYISDSFRLSESYTEFIPKGCVFATPSDWRYGYSELMGGPNIVMLTPLFNTPDTVLHFAEEFNADYLIVTNLHTMFQIYLNQSVDPFECANPAGGIISIAMLNATIPKDSFKLHVRFDPQINGRVSFYMDYQRYGSIELKNGSAVATITEIPSGEHHIQVKYNIGGAFVKSNLVTIFANSTKPWADQGQVGYCQPWWFQPDDLGLGSHIVYEIPGFVKVWCISLQCASIQAAPFP